MAKVEKIDSNIVGCRYAEEEAPKVLPNKPVWHPLETNSYSDFGAQLTTIARNPINPGRQMKKGVVSDLDASGGFAMDLTQDNCQDLLQGFFFADYQDRFRIPMDRLASTRITATKTGKIYGYTGDISGLNNAAILHVTGFTNPENNGRKTVKTLTAGTGIAVNEDLVDEVGDDAAITLVGIVGLPGDVSIDVSPDNWPKLVLKNATFTGSPLKVGEWIYLGGDSADSAFDSDVNNGYKRIRAIEAKALYFDKYDEPMVTDKGTGKKIEIYFGRNLKNEVGSKVKARTYQIERTLGAPDPSKPADLQSEYVVGALANEFTMNIPQAEKITVDLSFVATDAEQRTATDGLKTGDRPQVKAATAFNTSSDFRRIRLAKSPDKGTTFESLFKYVTELTLTINNNVNPIKAIGVLGAFDTTAGSFEVTGSLTAYFADIEAVRAVRQNADVTLDLIMAKENAAIVIDLPLLTLGNGQVTIEQDNPITLPLDFTAAEANKLSKHMNYTIMMAFFDYLPDRAAAGVGAS